VQEHDERFRELVDLLPQMIFELDPDLHVTYANRCALNTIGLSDQDLKEGIDLFSFIDPSQHARIKENLQKFRENMVFESQEYTALKMDGSRFPVVIHSAPIYQDDTLSGFCGVIDDISEQKMREDALRESEVKYRALFENANDAITVHGFGPDGIPSRFIEVNENVCRLTEYTREELLRMTPMELDDPVSWKEARGCMKTLMEQGHHVFERTHIRKDGTKIRVEISAHIFLLKNRKVCLSIVRDITERKRAEEALRKANKRLNLLSSLTRHDINNQLLVINGFAELLQSEIDDPSLEGFFSNITTASSRIADMIRFTREYENIGAGAPVWHGLADMLGTLAEEILPKGVRLTCNLPAGTEVFADPMLKKAFFNLLDNAVRHGERVTEIRVSSRPSENDLVVVLEDDGVGIPADEKDRIFEQGFGKNTGLGLFLVREILSLTGISIKECGEEGVGARFEITVPSGVYRVAGP